MSKFGDHIPKELYEKFGIEEEKQEEVSRVSIYEKDDEHLIDDEFVKENKKTISDLNRNRYSKSYVKIQPQYGAEEPGVMTTASDLMVIRENLLKKHENAKFDKTSGSHIISQILLKRTKKNKPTTIKNILSVALHKHTHLASFSNSDESNVRKTITNAMNKIAAIFGPDETKYDPKKNILDVPVITKTTKKRKKRMGEKYGGRNPVTYHITEEFLKYEAGQIWTVANEWAYEKQKQKKAGNTLIGGAVGYINKGAAKGHTTLSQLIEFRKDRLRVNKKTVFDPSNGSHLVVQRILDMATAGDDINIKKLHEIAVNEFSHTSAFTLGKDGNIRKYLSQIVGKIVDVFPDLIKRIKTQGTGHNFIIDESVLIYTAPQIWAVANEKAAFDRKMGKIKIEIPELPVSIKEVADAFEKEPTISEEAEEKLINGLEELSKESDSLSSALTLHTEPSLPALVPVRKSKGLLESSVGDIIESLTESGVGSLKLSITIDMRGEK